MHFIWKNDVCGGWYKAVNLLKLRSTKRTFWKQQKQSPGSVL